MGIMGPALTTVISNALVWLVGYIIVSLYISLPHRKMATMFSKIIGAVIGMSICILLLRSRISSLTVIIIAIVVYTVLVFCVGVLSKKQLQEWSQTLLKRPSL
jgi:chromate transport protein ChrA